MIGEIFNLITYSDNKMHQYSTRFYLLNNNNIILCFIMLITYNDLLEDYFENDSIIYCKIHYYLIVVLSWFSIYLMYLSNFDRCLSTWKNVKIHWWSQIKIVKHLSTIVIKVICLISIHIII